MKLFLILCFTDGTFTVKRVLHYHTNMFELINYSNEIQYELLNSKKAETIDTIGFRLEDNHKKYYYQLIAGKHKYKQIIQNEHDIKIMKAKIGEL